MFSLNSFKSIADKVFLLTLFSIIFSCKTTQKTENQSKKININSELSKPDNCYITGEITGIEKTLASDDSLSVCAKAPCYAFVRIKSVSGCGAAVVRSIHETDTLRVYFVFSLAPTTSIYPLIKPAFPGLQSGSIFEAFLEQRIAPGNQVNYRIYGYAVK